MATMERIVLALGARGLVNAQFIVRDDGVYLIEVNPRASRTVPFLSKVTGVPMVELAVRIALGATLPELGWDGGLLPPPAFVAVKAPAFSTAKLRGVDPSVGPGMQSTGEVIGLAHGPAGGARQGAARRGARPAAAGRRTARWRCSRSPTATRATLPRLATALAAAGYRLAATPGTRAALAAAGYEARPVAKLGEAADDVDRRGRRSSTSSRAARSGSSSTRRRRAPGAVRDAAEIRLAATAEGILCLTAMETAVAAAEALDPSIAERLSDVRSLDEWVPRRRRRSRRLRSSVARGGVGDHDRLAERPERQRGQRHHHDRERDLARRRIAAGVRARPARARPRSRARPRRPACARRRPPPAARSRRARAAATRRTARGTRSRTGPSPAGTGRRSRRGCPGRRSAGRSGSGR